MATKLILTINDSTLKRAEIFDENTGRSLSELVENYLETLPEGHDNKKQLSSKLKKIVGVVKLPVDFDERKELNSYFKDKYQK